MIATLALVVANVAVYTYFALQAPSPLDIGMFSASMGVSLPALEGGGVHRLITNLFFHFDFPHLGYNMLFLLIFGARCEKVLGQEKFLLVFFASGILSSLSVFLYPPGSTLAGSSGAIFGVLGSVLVAQRNLYSHGFLTSLLLGALFFVIAVTTGFLSHLFGLIMGFMLGYLFTYQEEG